MQIFRPASARGEVNAGWLQSRHTFSFGQYHDPEWMGWGPLRVINDDRVAPRGGFPPHRHANMEILSYVIDGALAHRDDSGGEGVLRAGEWQWMSAGHGIEHSEFNASQTEPVHFLQIWIQPDRVNAAPAHAQQRFDPAQRRGQWAVLASPDGSGGSLAIRQQAWLHGVGLGDGETVAFDLRPDRRYWLQLVQGSVTCGDRTMVAGDALGFTGESAPLHLSGAGTDVADVILFDLPV